MVYKHYLGCYLLHRVIYSIQLSNKKLISNNYTITNTTSRIARVFIDVSLYCMLIEVITIYDDHLTNDKFKYKYNNTTSCVYTYINNNTYNNIKYIITNIYDKNRNTKNN